MSILLYTPIISFYVSFIGIITMIGFKYREIKTGKRSFIYRLTQGVDHKVHNIAINIRKFIMYFNRKTALALIQWIAYHILTWARNLYIWLYKKAHAHAPSKKVIDMVRGKGEINRNGGSSFYLKSISGASFESGEIKK